MALPKITLCHKNGYSEDVLLTLGYDSLKSFTVGRVLNKTLFGWLGNHGSSVKDIFEQAYIAPSIQDLLRNDSYLKINGKDRIQLMWKENPMVYPETTMILKFHDNMDFFGKIQLTMSDPNHEYYLPDIFVTFRGKL